MLPARNSSLEDLCYAGGLRQGEITIFQEYGSLLDVRL